MIRNVLSVRLHTLTFLTSSLVHIRQKEKIAVNKSKQVLARIFRLLQAANIYSVRRKAQPGYNKIDRIKRRTMVRSKTMEEEKLSETVTVEKVNGKIEFLFGL